jgi:3'-5' exoribonuclease
MRNIQDLKENEHVIEHYFCKQKQSLKTNSGKTYYSLKLQDKTGLIDAKVWELTNEIQAFEEGEMIKVDGVVLTYRNEPQMKITRIRRSDEGEYEPMDYIPTTDKDINKLYDQVTEYINSINDPMIRELMENIMILDDSVVKAFKSHSAAKNLHHNYMGGLLEHTVSVVQICDFMSGRAKYINRDLLIATALLHDIGKIYELSRLPENDYTDDGQMLGHIVMGLEMVTAEAAKIPGFPHELKSLIKHSILSHHGELEFGSPKLPNTMEAFILHCADNMDAKLKAYEETLDKDSTTGPWAGYHRMLNRYVRKSDYNG